MIVTLFRQMRGTGITPRWAAPALVAAGATVVCELIGWRGTDVAEQVYRVAEVRRYGLNILDPGWYGGMYLPSYSLVFTVVAALAGIWVTAGAAAALAAACFDSLMRSVLGRRSIGVWYLAGATTVEVAIGQLAFLSGEALGLAAVLALTRRRTALGVLLSMLTALASPVAGAFLTLAVVAWALSDRGQRRKLLTVGLIPLVVVGGIALLFPGSGWFPFDAFNAVTVVLLCALIASPALSPPRVLRIAAALYGAVTLVLFVVPTMMGGNDLRLAADIGIPVLLCYGLDRFRRPFVRSARSVGGAWLGCSFAGALIVWAWAPAVSALEARSSTAASSQLSFYQPLLSELRDVTVGPTRVEIPPSFDHWESAWVAPSFPLARGWERQLDMGQNPIFYTPGALTPRTYRAWLTAQGVTYVALPNAPLDFAAIAEAALLRSGATLGLQRIWSNADWTLWRVLGSPGLVSGPATLRSIGPDHLDLTVEHSGLITIRVHWSAYWSLPPSGGCLDQSPDGWTELRANKAGPVTISASLLHTSVSCPDSVMDGRAA